MGSKQAETFGPKVAVYPPGSKTRSNLTLLREQHRAPSGKFTTSSLHPPNMQGAAYGAGVGKMPKANPKYTGQQQQEYEDDELMAQYVDNLREQADMLQAQVNMYQAAGMPPVPAPTPALRSKKPPTAPAAVFTSAYPPRMQGAASRDKLGTAIVGSRHMSPRAKAAAASEAENAALRERMQAQERITLAAQQQQLREEAAKQELLTLRRVAATEKKAALSTKEELEEALRNREQLLKAQAGKEQSLQSLQARFDLAMEELKFVKNELDVARSRSPHFSPYNGASPNGLVYDGVDIGDATIYAACGKTPGELLAEVEGLRAQAKNYEEIVEQRDAHIKELTELHKSLSSEIENLNSVVRHEQQKYQILTGTAESDKVMLSNATSEVEFLRCAQRGLEEDVKRLTSQNDELFARLRHELEARQLKDAQFQTTMDGTCVLHSEAAKVRQLLLAEQGVNNALRTEIANLEKQLFDERAQKREILEQYDKLKDDLKGAQSNYEEQAEALAANLANWRAVHEQQASQEKQTMGLAQKLVEGMKASAVSASNKITQQETQNKHDKNVQVFEPIAAETQTVFPTARTVAAVPVIARHEQPVLGLRTISGIETDIKQILNSDQAARKAAAEAMAMAQKALDASHAAQAQEARKQQSVQQQPQTQAEEEPPLKRP